jgi:hypothetical protein
MSNIRALYLHREDDSSAQSQTQLWPRHGSLSPDQDIQIVEGVGKFQAHHLPDLPSFILI